MGVIMVEGGQEKNQEKMLWDDEQKNEIQQRTKTIQQSTNRKDNRDGNTAGEKTRL